MITDHTPDSLRAFEAEIADLFNAGKIRAPVHLAGGNEAALIEIFRSIRAQDWVLTTWRSHYHCLLKGVHPERLKSAIMRGSSITLTFPEHRIVSSAIVGGMLPVAVGLGKSIALRDPYLRPIEFTRPGQPPEMTPLELDKNAWDHPRVWVFVGDMAAETGAFSECLKYSFNHSLPIRFVIEDNGISVCTDTAEVWGLDQGRPPGVAGNVIRYSYKLPWPHSGAGKRVNF